MFEKPFFLSLFIVCFLISCSSIPEHKGTSFDLSQVDKMAFKFEGNTQFMGTSLPVTDISEKVSANLAEWGYQFVTEPSNEYSHDLSIHIGSSRLGATPTGFSFSPGNSDPRALNFQKATTIPLTCSLMPKGQSSQRAELVMEVIAEQYEGTDIISVSKQKMIRRLTDDISTTCFNLLSSLKIKTVKNESTAEIITPTWIPKIRIEIENIPEDDNKSIDTEARAGGAGEEIKQSVKVIKNEPRKRMIIHNQGTPVIFKFGPDR